MHWKGWAFAVCFGVNLYLLGVMVVFGAVLYPQLGAVDRGAFGPAYQAFNTRIGGPVVAFELLSVAVVLPLYVARPAAVPTWGVHLLMALSVAYFAITFGWHLPSHRLLATGDNSPVAMTPLLSSQWARTGVQFVRAAALMGWVAKAL